MFLWRLGIVGSYAFKRLPQEGPLENSTQFIFGGFWSFCEEKQQRRNSPTSFFLNFVVVSSSAKMSNSFPPFLFRCFIDVKKSRHLSGGTANLLWMVQMAGVSTRVATHCVGALVSRWWVFEVPRVLAAKHQRCQGLHQGRKVKRASNMTWWQDFTRTYMNIQVYNISIYKYTYTGTFVYGMYIHIYIYINVPTHFNHIWYIYIYTQLPSNIHDYLGFKNPPNFWRRWFFRLSRGRWDMLVAG